MSLCLFRGFKDVAGQLSHPLALLLFPPPLNLSCFPQFNSFGVILVESNVESLTFIILEVALFTRGLPGLWQKVQFLGERQRGGRDIFWIYFESFPNRLCLNITQTINAQHQQLGESPNSILLTNLQNGFRYLVLISAKNPNISVIVSNSKTYVFKQFSKCALRPI